MRSPGDGRPALTALCGGGERLPPGREAALDAAPFAQSTESYNVIAFGLDSQDRDGKSRPR